MLHSPYGADDPQAKCIVNRQCSKHFPEDYRKRTDWAEDSVGCYNLITQVATLALRLEDGLRVRGKGMHNRLSVRRYSVSTGAYILIVVQKLGLQ